MLTTEEIKKELDAGREVELECVDRDGFKSSCEYAEKILSADKLAATSCDQDGVNLNNNTFSVYSNFLLSSELQYFRIKRPAPTFDDLIDVAVKAVREGKLHKFTFNQSLGYTDIIWLYTLKDESKHFTHDQAQCGIEFINSLYTETFVIESAEDFEKFKLPVESIVLANGENIINDVMFHKDRPYFTKGDGSGAFKIGFKILKGATVTQKRGAA